MSIQNIVNTALANARAKAGGGGGATKTASSSGSSDLVKLAHQLADANEYIALSSTADGTADGQARQSVVETFFKNAGGEKVKGPPQSESPTGTQAVPPQSGAKKILPLGKASGNSPAESEAPTGTQATLDQTGTKKAGAPVTLLDMITKIADTAAIPGPKQSVAGENAEPPPAKNENTNIGALRSAAGMVAMTRRDAKLPTRARLRELFAHADDTGPSSAAAQAAFPNAYAKGGMKVAGADEEAPQRPSPLRSAGKGALIGGLAAGAIGAGVGGAVGKGMQHIIRSMPMSTKKEFFQHVGGAQERQLLKNAIRRAGVNGAVVGGITAGASGITAGGQVGAIHGAGRRHQFDIDHKDKKASIADYAKLASLAESGELGEEARALITFAESLPL